MNEDDLLTTSYFGYKAYMGNFAPALFGRKEYQIAWLELENASIFAVFTLLGRGAGQVNVCRFKGRNQ